MRERAEKIFDGIIGAPPCLEDAILEFKHRKDADGTECSGMTPLNRVEEEGLFFVSTYNPGMCVTVPVTRKFIVCEECHAKNEFGREESKISDTLEA
jgi:hypothetical protein